MNEDVTPPTITVGVNGKTASANLPSGGSSEWEELDLSNLPTDFTDNDILKIDIHFYGGLIFRVEDWNSSIEESNILEFDNGSIIIEKGMDDIVPGPNVVYSAYYAAGGIVLSAIKIGHNLNLDNLFYLDVFAFNAATHISKQIVVTRTNVSTYINHLWRKKR